MKTEIIYATTDLLTALQTARVNRASNFATTRLRDRADWIKILK